MQRTTQVDSETGRARANDEAGPVQPRHPLGGVAGNARLTAVTGLLLLVLLFLEGMTLPVINRFVAAHIFFGLLLIPPLALKLGTTGYRFVMYYGGNHRYRAAGPPGPILRVAAPFLILTTIMLFGSGIELMVVGPQNAGLWRRVHIVSFLLWFWIMALHVLGHTWRAFSLGAGDVAPRLSAAWMRVQTVPDGRFLRRSLVLMAILAGVILAVWALPSYGAWTSWVTRFGGG